MCRAHQPCLPGASKPGRDREGTDRRKCPVPLHTHPMYRPHGLRSEDRLHDLPPASLPAEKVGRKRAVLSGCQGPAAPRAPRHLPLWRRPRPEPPRGLQGAAQGPEGTHLFFLNDSVYSFILAVPILEYLWGFSPAVGHGLLFAAASPAAETGSGRQAGRSCGSALPARQSWYPALAAPACGGFLVRTVSCVGRQILYR